MGEGGQSADLCVGADVRGGIHKAQSVPRLAYEELPPRLAALLEGKVERLGYLGEFFQVGANLPDVLEPFVWFTDRSKAHVPQELVEVIALTVASAVGNDYERIQHEHLCLRLGYRGDWVRTVQEMQPGRLDDTAEAATQTYVIAALERYGSGARSQFEALVDAVGYEVALGVAFVVARYVAHALIANTLEFEPPVPPADLSSGDTRGTAE